MKKRTDPKMKHEETGESQMARMLSGEQVPITSELCRALTDAGYRVVPFQPNYQPGGIALWVTVEKTA